MQLVVSDRESVEAGLSVRTSFVVISIRDARKRRAKVPKQAGLKDVLFLAFDDAEPSAQFELPASVKLMTEAQAREVWAFVAKHQASVGTIVVHCEQGMSRSPAVAAALSRALGHDETRFWRDFAPNRFVYELLLKLAPQA